MRRFVALIEELDRTTRTKEKVQALERYFREAEHCDKIWVVALFTGRRPRGIIKLANLRKWAAETSGIPQWLFDESYHFVGDLAETMALLAGGGLVSGESGERIEREEMGDWVKMGLDGLFRYLEAMRGMDEERQREWVIGMWGQMQVTQRFVFNKFLTGGFRMGVSEQLLFQAVGLVEEMETGDVAHALMGKWDPFEETYDALIRGGDDKRGRSKPYPFALCYAMEDEVEEGLAPWQLEWKWDGIRGQLIKRNGDVFLWSRGEELVNDMFPEVVKAAQELPDGVVLDGELLVWGEDNLPQGFQQMQRRLGRKKVGKKLLMECPVKFMAYDLLEWQCNDMREFVLRDRRKLLESLFDLDTKQRLSPVKNGGDGLLLSPKMTANNWEEAREIRARALEIRAEGLMVKRLDSTYPVGRKRGDWWKWKLEAETVDCVMIYAQRGHGRRASLYTDFTFAVRDAETLVPFAKAYSGLTDAEFLEINQWIKQNTRESFGPVRSVTAELVFEVAFEGIALSKRHKSGIAVRFPRIVRWRRDKKVEEIASLDDLKMMIAHREGEKNDNSLIK